MAINLNTRCSSQLANVSFDCKSKRLDAKVTVTENINLEKGRANLDFDDLILFHYTSSDNFLRLYSEFFVTSQILLFLREILTADAAMFLVGAIATSVPAAASYCVGTTSSIVASEWAVSRGDSATIAHPARSSGLVTAVPAGNYRVAKFVCWQTLAVVASERTLGTFCTNREISRIN